MEMEKRITQLLPTGGEESSLIFTYEFADESEDINARIIKVETCNHVTGNSRTDITAIIFEHFPCVIEHELENTAPCLTETE
jgi:hypothetical protein